MAIFIHKDVIKNVNKRRYGKEDSKFVRDINTYYGRKNTMIYLDIPFIIEDQNNKFILKLNSLLFYF